MLQRWRPAAVVAAVLAGINLVGRLVGWRLGHGDERRLTRIGLVEVAVVALVLVYAGYRWACRRPMPRVFGELSVAVLVGLVFSFAVGPYAGGSAPFVEGGALVYAEAWHYLVLAAVGIGFGVLVAMALGRDWKSQAYKRYAESRQGRPRRPVRR